ncbi:MAG: hypothetical protein ACK4NR_09200 [Micavibrio sp.]
MTPYSLRKHESVEVTIPGGAVITSRPVTRASFEACRADAERLLEKFKSDPEAARAAGFDPDADFKDDGIIAGLYTHYLIVSMGRRHITGWNGIANETGDTPAEVNPETVDILLSDPVVSKLYYQQMMMGPALLEQLKKGSGAGVNGTSSQAAAPDTAKDAVS